MYHLYKIGDDVLCSKGLRNKISFDFFKIRDLSSTFLMEELEDFCAHNNKDFD